MATFLEARWRHLCMAHFRVPHELVAPHVPAGTELDDYHGDAYVSLIGFRFFDTRVRGIAVPLHRDFNEVNLRAYVRRRVAGEVRHGVVFVREIVSLPAIAFAARLSFNEPYMVLPTRSRAPGASEPTSGALAYEWRSGSAWDRLLMIPSAHRFGGGESVEQFLSVRHWGYTRQRNGGTIEYRVEHGPWQLFRPEHTEVKCSDASVFGESFREVLRREPDVPVVADGSPITVSMPQRIA